MSEDGNKFLKIAVGCGVLAAGLGIGSYFGIYVPQLEREKIAKAEEMRSAQRTEAREHYNACIDDSQEIYSRGWDRNCNYVGIDHKTSRCQLPASHADDLNRQNEVRKQRCLEIFKAEM